MSIKHYLELFSPKKRKRVLHLFPKGKLIAVGFIKKLNLAFGNFSSFLSFLVPNNTTTILLLSTNFLTF